MKIQENYGSDLYYVEVLENFVFYWLIIFVIYEGIFRESVIVL